MAGAANVAQLGEIGHDEVGLMRRLAEWPLPAVNEHSPHAVGFRADAIQADDLGCLGIGLPVRLKIPPNQTEKGSV